jgi:hypothetical protein
MMPQQRQTVSETKSTASRKSGYWYPWHRIPTGIQHQGQSLAQAEQCAWRFGVLPCSCLRRSGAELLTGRAKLVGKHEVHVEGPEGSKTVRVSVLYVRCKAEESPTGPEAMWYMPQVNYGP